MMSMKLSNTGTLNIKGYDYSCIINGIIDDYCCVIFGISKSEAINLIQNVDLTEKSWTS